MREFFQLCMPTVLAGWIYAVYSMADGVFLGHYIGTPALASLNLVLPVLYIPYAFALLIGVGGGTLMARLRGEGRILEARRVAAQTLLALFVAGAVMMLPLLLFPRQMAHMLGAHGVLVAHCASFLQNYAVFMPFACAGPALGFLLRAEEARAARISLLAMSVGALLNAGLDCLFIAHLGMQMEGAALATGTGQFGAVLVMLPWLFRRHNALRPAMVPGPRYFCAICYGGISEFFSAIAPVVTIYAFNFVVVGQFGVDGLAAYAVLEYMTLGSAVTMLGLVQSMQPMVSYYRGANRPASMRQTLKVAGITLACCAIFFALLVLLASPSLVRMILPSGQAVWSIIGTAVPWYALAILPASMNLLVAGYLTSIEHPGVSLAISGSRSLVLLLVFLWGLHVFFGGRSIWLTPLLTELVTVLVSLAMVTRYHVAAIMMPLRRSATTAA